ncbi:MAG: potassium transporter TrkG [Ilumatobacteraceae bacterium]
MSTTGYATDDFGAWSQAAQAVIIILLPIGAMAGSTAGGVKMIRSVIASYTHREALRQLHPRLVRPVRVGGGIVPDAVANKIVGFLVLALATFGGGALLIALTGPDLITPFSAARPRSATSALASATSARRTTSSNCRGSPAGHHGADAARSARDLTR